MHIIGFLIFGLIIGLLARAIYPGRQHMGWLATAILGMIGSLVGGLRPASLFGGNTAADGSWGFTPGGWMPRGRLDRVARRRGHRPVRLDGDYGPQTNRLAESCRSRTVHGLSV